jgi:hypothetical protein
MNSTVCTITAKRYSRYLLATSSVLVVATVQWFLSHVFYDLCHA